MNAEKKNFYGWILLVAIGIMFLCSSGFILVGASVVNPLMMADSSMNMNATLMGLGFTLFVLCQGIPAPLIGQFITKYGQKKTFIVGGLLLIIGGLLMAFVVKTTIGYLIAFGVILSIGSQMAGQVTMQTSVSAWFVQKRALAMSIATVIGAIGSFISPRILNSIVASTGRWQDAWLLVAGLGVVVIIIAVALVVDKPSDKGQYPDGIEPGSAVAAAQKFSRVYKTSEVYDHKAVLKNRNFWFIALAATGAFCLYSLNSAAAVKHFTTQGFESAAIVAAVSYMGIANMVGKLSVGPIGDKVEPTRMMAVYLLIIAVGTLCSAFAKSQAMMVGKVALGAKIKIVAPDGSKCPVGRQGEIYAQGLGQMMCYYNAPDKTASVFSDGWYHTGDVGYLDEDNYLYLVGRMSDMIISGGENVYPKSVEECILALDGVENVAVVGLKDDHLGEAVTAVIVKAPGAELDEATVRNWCKGKIAGFMKPRKVFFVNELPVNSTGKIDKRKLTEMFN